MKFLREFWKWLTELFRRKKVKVAEKPIEVSLTEEVKVPVQIPERPTKPKIPIISKKKKPDILIRVGIDFGTRFTKVAYKIFGIPGRRLIRPVLFNHKLITCPKFCLPSVAAFDEKQNLLLGIEAEQLLHGKELNYGLRMLKVVLAGRHDPTFHDNESDTVFRQYMKDNTGDDNKFSPEFITAVYIAYVINESRKHILEEEEISDSEVTMEFNICMPIDHIENNNVRTVFEKNIAWAELIERLWEQNIVNYDFFQKAIELESRVSYQPENPETQVFAVAEAVAEGASYFNSLGRQGGIHAIIDFGAGTTDVAIFNLTDCRDKEEKAYFYAADNIPKGAVKIERIIADHLQNISGRNTNTVDVFETLQQLTRNYIERYPELKSKITNYLQELWKSTHSAWSTAYRHLTKETHWHQVQVFVCGGGAKTPYVEYIFSEPWWEQLQNFQIRYPVDYLPEPDEYDNINRQVPFHRMAVAYGLSYFSWEDFKKYILPKDCPDHTPPPLPSKSYESPDGKLYPTRGWLG